MFPKAEEEANLSSNAQRQLGEFQSQVQDLRELLSEIEACKHLRKRKERFNARGRIVA